MVAMMFNVLSSSTMSLVFLSGIMSSNTFWFKFLDLFSSIQVIRKHTQVMYISEILSFHKGTLAVSLKFFTRKCLNPINAVTHFVELACERKNIYYNFLNAFFLIRTHSYTKNKRSLMVMH